MALTVNPTISQQICFLLSVMSWKTAPQKVWPPRTYECELGKRVLADIIKLRISRWDLPGLGYPKCNDESPCKRRDGEKGPTEEKVMWRWRQRWEGFVYKTRNTKDHRHHRELGERHGVKPSEPEWPCQHLDFRPLISRTVIEQISVVLRHQVHDNFLCQP